MTTLELPKETTATIPSTRRAAYDEFLAAYADQHAEWVNGQVITYMSAKERHQVLLLFISTLLQLFVDVFKSGKVRTGPYAMFLAVQNAHREPDVFFISAEHSERLTTNRLEGPADLVIEIVSDDSVTRDRVDKFDEYEAAGIPEYWIIDPRPNRQRANFYQLDERGQYQPVLPDKNGVYRSAMLTGFWLNVNWLWQAELPAPLRALGEIAGRERVVEALGK